MNIHKTKQKAAPQFLHGTRTNKASPQYKLPNNFSHIQADFTNWVDTHTTPEHLALLSLQEEVGNLLSLFIIVHVSKGRTSRGFYEPVAL